MQNTILREMDVRIVLLIGVVIVVYVPHCVRLTVGFDSGGQRGSDEGGCCYAWDRGTILSLVDHYSVSFLACWSGCIKYYTLF